MLKSCKYCGGIHPSGYTCPKKPPRSPHKGSKAVMFRRTNAWRKKRDEIVRRDFHMCRVCNEGTYGAFGIPGINNQPLQVHHIKPLEERFDLRLVDDNLITCCDGHHKMAEAGEIPRGYLQELAKTSPRWG